MTRKSRSWLMRSPARTNPLSKCSRVLATLVACAALLGHKALTDVSAPSLLCPKTEVVYHTALPALPQSLDPIKIRNFPTTHVGFQIHEGLLRLDEGVQLRPGIAEWEPLDGGLRHVFTIKDNARFHSDQRIRPQDVVHSLQRIIKEDDQRTFLRAFESIIGVEEYRRDDAGAISGIEIRGENQVEISLLRQDSLLFHALASPQCGIVPKPAGDVAPSSGSYQVGAGPFRVKSMDDESVTIVRHSRYHGKAARLDKVVFHLVPDDQVLKMFRAGRIYDTFGYSAYNRLETSVGEGEELVEKKLPILYFLAMDTRKGPFSDRRFREAMHCALDRSLLLSAVFPGQDPASSNIPYGISGYRKGAYEHTFDRSRAKKLIEECRKDGVPAEQVTLYARSTIRRQDRFSQIVRQSYGAAGLKVKVEYLSTDDFYKRFYKRDMGFFFAGHNVALNDAHYVLAWYESGNAQSFTGLKDVDLDRSLARARHAQTENKRCDYYREADGVISRSFVQIPLYNNVFRGLVRSNVAGFSINSFGPTVRLADVWIRPN